MSSLVGEVGSRFSRVRRHLVEDWRVGVDDVNDLRASEAHATEVVVNCALAAEIWKEAHGHLLEWVRLQSMYEDMGQEARGAETRTSVAVPSQCVVQEKARNLVDEVHHAGNHRQGRLLHRLQAVRVVLSWQRFASHQEGQHRDAEAATSVPP